MIAAALRAEIERCIHEMRTRNPLFAGKAEGPIRARGPGPAASLAPFLAALEVRADGLPKYLACRAFFQSLVAENGRSWMKMVEQRCGIPPQALAFLGVTREECRERIEEALDEIDVLVVDPTQLPVLRAELRSVIASFNRLCVEVSRAERTGDAHVSAA